MLGGLLALGALPLAAESPQAGKVYRLGYLSQPSRESVEQVLQAFLRALRELGWIEGQNLVIDYRWADGKIERLPELAAELVRLKVDLIVAPAGVAALAAKKATSSIPIVMIFPADPIDLGLVASLSRPGGNVTGTTYTPGAEIFGKQLQILKEAVPYASRIAVLRQLTDKGWDVQNRVFEEASQSMGVKLQQVQARGAEEFDSAFAAMARGRAQAVLVAGTSTYLVHRARLAELAIKARLPTMFNFREMVEAGGLMGYAVNMSDFIPRAAVYVDKILKGAKPADLPVEQPTKFELVINLKTAKAIGLAIPPLLLQRADAVIQ
jgi:putative ABC transport system substrate-binding protein